MDLRGCTAKSAATNICWPIYASAVPFNDAVLGAAIGVHRFGDFQQFNPHLHLIAADGCFSGNGTFTKIPAPEPKDLQVLFRYEVFKMLKAEGKISDAVIENMLS